MNRKLKKEFEKGTLEELVRMQKEMSVLEPNSKEYAEMLDRYQELSKIVNDKTTNDTKLKSTWIDNLCGFIGVGLSVFFPVVLGRLPNPQSWTFMKNKFKH